MDLVEIVLAVIAGIVLFVPAMLPNSAAVVLGGGTKMDFGRSWRGKRIFGDGKSWRGFFGGAAGGIFIGLVIIGASLLWDSSGEWGYGPFWGNLVVIASLAFGAVLGDLCGAFIKRRLGMERGQKAPVLDQYDFVIGAFLLTSLTSWDWVYSHYIEGPHIAALAVLIIMMFSIHRIANIIGYKMGLKKEPW